MNFFILVTLQSFLHLNPLMAAPVKEIRLKPQDVGTINTAVGYSTVIQFPQKPQNVVLGDQSAFRVEFIKDSITVRPNGTGLKSNLFVFTENDRFNLTVRSGATANVDYVVRVRRTFTDPEKVIQLNSYRTNGDVRLHLYKITQKNSNSFFDFAIENLGKKSIRLEPELFRITKNNRTLSVTSLYLNKESARSKDLVSGSFIVPGTESSRRLGIWIGFKDQRPKSFNFGNSAPATNSVGLF